MLLLIAGAVLTVTPTFVKECEFNHTPGIQGVELLYQIGTVGGEDAFQMLVTFTAAATSWGAVGLRAQGQQGMSGLNIVAFDSDTDAVTEYSPVAGNVKPSTVSTTTNAVFVEKVSAQSKTTVTFFRKMTVPDPTAFSFSLGNTINVALATGTGTAGTAGTWTGHTVDDREASDLTFAACPAVPASPPSAPQAAPIASAPVNPPQVSPSAPQAAPIASAPVSPPAAPPVASPIAPSPSAPAAPDAPTAPAATPSASSGGSSNNPLGIIMVVLGIVVLGGVLAAFYYYSRPRGNNAGMDWNEMRDAEREIEATVDQASTIRGPDDANQGYKHMPF